MNSAPSETSIEGFASPSAVGASQTPNRPPSSSPAGRERAGDEALPVAGDGVGHDQHDQHPVEHVHRRSSNLVLGRTPSVRRAAHPAACSRQVAHRRVRHGLGPAEEVEAAGR